MKLKDLKEKLKNKVQESKTKQFVEEHKRGIKLGLILIPIGALGIYDIKVNYELAKISNRLAGYREGFKDGIMTLSIGIDEALKNNNVTPELCDKLVKDSAKVVKPIVQQVFKD